PKRAGSLACRLCAAIALARSARRIPGLALPHRGDRCSGIPSVPDRKRGRPPGSRIGADALPFIVVNRKDAYARRVFSLLHELAHLMLRQSGVSDLDADGPRRAED
ncbi:hypothetical protein CNY89_26350, partial [Amaricoccus sp. HAR-UPW-R2A-40]